MIHDSQSIKNNGASKHNWLLRSIGWVMALVLILLFFVIADFVRFASITTNTQEDALTATHIPSADAIVVLTGGSGRLKQAIELLQKKKNTRLLISGVNPNTSKQQLQKLTKTDAALFECCVDIDYQALNTVGNANETIIWAKQHGFKSLIIVTSNYHMPRSILLLERANSTIKYMPYPIASSSLDNKNWITSYYTLKILIKEYIKYTLTYWNFL